MVIRITYPNHGHGSDFLCFLLMNENVSHKITQITDAVSCVVCYALQGFLSVDEILRRDHSVKLTEQCFPVMQFFEVYKATLYFKYSVAVL